MRPKRNRAQERALEQKGFEKRDCVVRGLLTLGDDALVLSGERGDVAILERVTPPPKRDFGEGSFVRTASGIARGDTIGSKWQSLVRLLEV